MTKGTQTTQVVKGIRAHMGTRLDWLDTLPKGSTGAELGVFEGAFSEQILQRVMPRMLYLVDLFDGIVRSGDANGDNVHGAFMPAMEPKLRLKYAGNSVEVVRCFSWVFLGDIGESVLDWVYIDTDHGYVTTGLELQAARRAVRAGGIIAGHDFSERYPGVVRAVVEFCEMHRLEKELWIGDKLASYAIMNRKSDGSGR